MTHPVPASPERRALVTGTVVTLAARMFQLAEPFGVDTALFALIGREMAGGTPLYLGAVDHKPPLLYWIYASWIGLFGPSDPSIQGLDLACALLATAMFVRLAARLLPPLLVTPATIFYAVVHAGYLFGGFWVHGQAEAILEPFVLAGLALAVGRPGAPPGRGALVASGALVAAAILIKLSALPIFGLIVVAGAVRGAAPGAALAWPALGGLAIGTVTVAILAVSGLLEGAFRCTILFNVFYVSDYPLKLGPELLPYILSPWWTELWPLYVMAVVGLLGGPRDREALLCWSFWAMATAEVVIQKKFWSYHYIPLSAPWALLAAMGLPTLHRLLGAGTRGLRRGIVTACVIVPCVVHAITYNIVHKLPQLVLGSGRAADALETYIWPSVGFSASDSLLTAGALRRLLPAGTRLFIWGTDPHIYLWSAIPPASRYLIGDHVVFNITPEGRSAEEILLADLERHRPAILSRPQQRGFLLPGSTEEWLDRLPDLKAFLARNYEPAIELPGDMEVRLPRSNPDRDP